MKRLLRDALKHRSMPLLQLLSEEKVSRRSINSS